MSIRRGITIFSRGGPRYLYISFNTCNVQTIAIPFCTADSRDRVTCVIGSTIVHCVFINRRCRCSATFHSLPRYPDLRHLVLFSSGVIGGPRSGLSVCFSRFLRVNISGVRSFSSRVTHHSSRRALSSLTGVLCASNAANIDGNIVLARLVCHRTLITRGGTVILARGSIILGFLPLARIFRQT